MAAEADGCPRARRTVKGVRREELSAPLGWMGDGIVDAKDMFTLHTTSQITHLHKYPHTIISDTYLEGVEGVSKPIAPTLAPRVVGVDGATGCIAEDDDCCFNLSTIRPKSDTF